VAEVNDIYSEQEKQVELEQIQYDQNLQQKQEDYDNQTLGVNNNIGMPNNVMNGPQGYGAGGLQFDGNQYPGAPPAPVPYAGNIQTSQPADENGMQTQQDALSNMYAP